MKKVRYILLFMAAALLMAGCGRSYKEEQRLSAQERAKQYKDDSLALKVAVMPTLDCLPLMVAQEANLFDTLGADVRLKYYTAQMDCDTALSRGRVEGSITDLIRAERLISKGTPLRYVPATNTYWQFITNRLARLKEIKQLEDKMIAMTRYSATDYLADYAIDSVKLKHDKTFKVQVNDVIVRLNMLLNNEMDAMLLTEPQATVARMYKNPVLMDTRKMNINLGVIVFREKALRDKRRQQQLSIFVKAYNQACDSINKNGVKHYRKLIAKYCKVKEAVADSIPKMTFSHAQQPRLHDITIAKKRN